MHISVSSQYPGDALTLREAENLTVNGHLFSQFCKKLSQHMSGIMGTNIKLLLGYKVHIFGYINPIFCNHQLHSRLSHIAICMSSMSAKSHGMKKWIFFMQIWTFKVGDTDVV